MSIHREQKRKAEAIRRLKLVSEKLASIAKDEDLDLEWIREIEDLQRATNTILNKWSHGAFE